MRPVKRPEGFDSGLEHPARKPNSATSNVDAKSRSSSKTSKSPRRRNAEIRSETVPRPKSIGVKSLERQRSKIERHEIKKFTRRARRRRASWLAAISVVALLSGMLAVAIFSPLMSLRVIQVEGATTLDAKVLQNALSSQIGTPLALIDYGKIKQDLDAFPRIRSFVTEAVPPSTLVIRISERSPIAQVQSSSGFQIIDAAGVVITTSSTRVEGLPLLLVDAPNSKSSAFRATVQVLLSLPSSIRSVVTEIKANSQDSVVFAMSGVHQSVIWGSSERSDLKAKVLEDLIKVQGGKANLEYDVSAPLSPVVREG